MTSDISQMTDDVRLDSDDQEASNLPIYESIPRPPAVRGQVIDLSTGALVRPEPSDAALIEAARLARGSEIRGTMPQGRGESVEEADVETAYGTQSRRTAVIPLRTTKAVQRRDALKARLEAELTRRRKHAKSR